MDVTIQMSDWLDAPALAERPCFVIGGVHGRDDLFEGFLGEIERVIASDQLENAIVIGLGDHIDRGPSGIAALKRALDAKSEKYEFRVLPGNHEQFLAAVLLPGSDLEAEIFRWFRNGGRRIAQELGFAESQDVFSHLVDFLERPRSALGPDRIRQFLDLLTHLCPGQYLFVHAGIQPDSGMSMLEKPCHDVPIESDTSQSHRANRFASTI
jgi:serine/threonine protein phosphatase 1